MLRRGSWLFAVILLLAGTAAPAGAVQIAVTYTDPAGQGFHDATLGPTRQAAFNFAAAMWASRLLGSVPVVVDAEMPSLGGDATSATLGVGGPTTLHRDFPGAPIAATWYPPALASQLLTPPGDVNGSTPEIAVSMNADVDNPQVLGAISWYYGTDAHAGNDVDFVSVAFHELCHGLGFDSEVAFGVCVGGSTPGADCGANTDCGSGTCSLAGAGAWAHGFPAIYDTNLEAPGVGQFPSLTNAQRRTAMTSGNVLWNGPAVVAAHGSPAPVFAPNPAQPGSSISHWDPSITPAQLMGPAYTGPTHDPGLAAPALADEGWEAGSSPGPTGGVTTTSMPGPTTTTTTLVCNGRPIFDADEGGCLPPDAPDGPITRCENRVGKATSKLVGGLLRCHILRARGKLADDAAEEVCKRAATGRFMATHVGSCGPCTSLAPIASGAQTAVSAGSARIYCASGGAAFGTDDTGILPADAPAGPLTACENRVAKATGKLAVAIVKCHARSATGRLTDAGEDACETAALAKVAATPTAGCGTCTDLAGLAAFVRATVGAWTAPIYCQAL